MGGNNPGGGLIVALVVGRRGKRYLLNGGVFNTLITDSARAIYYGLPSAIGNRRIGGLERAGPDNAGLEADRKNQEIYFSGYFERRP